MKKILLVVCLLMLTGCKDEIVCKITRMEDSYETEEKIVFNIEDEKVKTAKIDYIMTFKDEATAKAYSQMFESLEGNYKINLDKNKLQVSSEKDYLEYNQSAESLKKEFESTGYSCK